MRGDGSPNTGAEAGPRRESRTALSRHSPFSGKPLAGGGFDFALISAPGILGQCDAARPTGRDAAPPGVAAPLINGRGHA